MKKIVIITSIAIALIACKNEDKPKELVQTTNQEHNGHNHNEHSDHDEKSDDHSGHNHDEHSDHDEKNEEEGIVHLTKAQYELTGVETSKIKKQNMSNSVHVSGQIAVPPLGFASVYAPLGGFVRKGDLLPGDYVKKGQMLAIIEHPDYIKIQEDYLKAYAKKEFYLKEYNRQVKLKDNLLNSQKRFHESLLNKNTYEAEYLSLKAQLKIIGISTTKIHSKGIQKNITISSPISGYITENNINLGKYVSENDQLYGIVNKVDMHAELQVYTTDLGQMAKGIPFEFEISGSNEIFKGEIALIGETVDQETKTVDIHGEILSGIQLLKPGMFINAKIFPSVKQTNVIPNSSIFKKDDKTFIFKKNSELEYEVLEITLGQVNDDYSEIINIQNSNFDIEIVTKGIYQLESSLIKSEGGLGHGHVH